MSNRRTTRHPVIAMAERFAGQQLPGGCEDCDAFQVFERDADQLMVVRLTVHHDDTCPWLRARRTA